MPSPYAEDLEFARNLADAADVITLARFGAADLRVESKPDLTPVSDADRAVEASLRERIALLRPGDAICGEEYGTEGDGPRRWVIDPIDGTKNYVRGVPVWATLIALLDGDDPVVGVVRRPGIGTTLVGGAGHGCVDVHPRAAPRALSVSAVSRLEDASLAYSSLGGWATSAGDGVSRPRRSRVAYPWVRRLLVVHALAEGAVDLATEPELSLWDMAALYPIVTEAGGRFTGLDGTDGVLGADAAASNGVLHDALLAALATRSADRSRGRRVRAAAGSCRRTRATGTARRGVPVGRARPCLAGHRLEQVEVGRARRVPAGDQAADHARRTVRPEHQVGPPARARTVPCRSAADSSARVTVVPTATTRPPAARVEVHRPRRGRGHAEPFGLRRLSGLLRRDAGVQRDRCDADAAGRRAR